MQTHQAKTHVGCNSVVLVFLQFFNNVKKQQSRTLAVLFLCEYIKVRVQGPEAGRHCLFWMHPEK